MNLAWSEKGMDDINIDKIHFLKANWCDITVLESEGKYALIDTGFKGSFYTIDSFLKSQGVNKLEFIFLSHFHCDHYGGALRVLENYEVDKLYTKEYKGLEKLGSSGNAEAEEYYIGERENYNAIIAKATEKSSIHYITPALQSITLGKIKLTVFIKDNNIERLYKDEESPFKGIKKFSENTNSTLLYAEFASGAAAVIAGDYVDVITGYEPVDMLNLKTAEEIGHKADIYKLPHHACGVGATEKIAGIYRPDHVVMTIGEEFMQNGHQYSDNLHNALAANPDVKFYYTAKQGYSFYMYGKGNISVRTII
jgi:beta-lactamase superfamily II metal-dependent hydrolase